MYALKKYTALSLVATIVLIAIGGCAIEPLPPQEVPEVEQEVIQGDHPYVALMLPLSGAHKKLGHSLQEAANLALEETGRRGVKMIAIDTGSDPSIASSALEKIKKGKKAVVIGPLFAKHAEEVAQALQGRPPVLTFSNDISLESKSGVYRLGLAPGELAVKALGYAKTQGYGDVYALIPSGRYGDILEQAMSLHQSSGLYQVRHIVRYSDDNISSIVKGLRQHAVPKLEELERTPVQGHGSAVVLAYETPTQLRHLLATWRSLEEADDAKVKFVGIGLWEHLEQADSILLDGGIAADWPQAELKRFEQRFQGKYGYRPQHVAVLAYDAALLASVALQKHAELTPETLHSPTGFRGTTGIFRFNLDGSIDRGLGVYEYHSGEWREVQPAPNKFG